jgi:hypothetical protein
MVNISKSKRMGSQFIVPGQNFVYLGYRPRSVFQFSSVYRPCPKSGLSSPFGTVFCYRFSLLSSLFLILVHRPYPEPHLS